MAKKLPARLPVGMIRFMRESGRMRSSRELNQNEGVENKHGTEVHYAGFLSLVHIFVIHWCAASPVTAVFSLVLISSFSIVSVMSYFNLALFFFALVIVA
ncbi:hypothetical protein NE237_007586 [Protea cynaroides]|uniref:Uncharacterized protein n=1 Tax=Protea cynaroides TaxID=273540 RepID=A0A9Q0QWJ2_9MAGN|nr:hypothetical protein NE237_007586 [Protea cynaroides]